MSFVGELLGIWVPALPAMFRIFGKRAMRVWRIDDGENHWYAAPTEAEAIAMHCEPQSARDLEDNPPTEWVVVCLPDNAPLTITFDDPGPRTKVTRTAKEWARIEGRGFLASTVY